MAIWSEEQVERLNRWQDCPHIHGYTCPGGTGCSEPNNRRLIATVDGWLCNCGSYRQNWAMTMMLNEEPPKVDWLKGYLG